MDLTGEMRSVYFSLALGIIPGYHFSPQAFQSTSLPSSFHCPGTGCRLGLSVNQEQGRGVKARRQAESMTDLGVTPDFLALRTKD